MIYGELARAVEMDHLTDGDGACVGGTVRDIRTTPLMFHFHRDAGCFNYITCVLRTENRLF